MPRARRWTSTRPPPSNAMTPYHRGQRLRPHRRVGRHHRHRRHRPQARMSRDDLLKTNAGIVSAVVQGGGGPLAPGGDHRDKQPAGRHVPHRPEGQRLPAQRVIGMAGCWTPPASASSSPRPSGSRGEHPAFVLGGHGDTMVPLPRFSTVAGVPITELLPRKRSRPSASAPRAAAPRWWACSRPAAPSTPRPRPRWRWAAAILKDKNKILPARST